MTNRRFEMYEYRQQFPLRSYSFDFIGFSVRTAGLPIEGTRKPLRPLLEG